MTDTPQQVDRELARYLVSGERVVAVVREHWFSLAKPVAAFVAALFVATYVEAESPRTNTGAVAANFFWYVALGAGLYLLWRLLNWWHDWFVVTDKRFLKFFGFIRRKVAMMPMGRVTDMTFDRSVLGRMLGYGTFILESAGQDQALSRIEFVPHAQRHYRAICDVLFGNDELDDLTGNTDTQPGEDSADDGWGGPDGPGGRDGHDPDNLSRSGWDLSRRVRSEPGSPHLIGSSQSRVRTWYQGSDQDRDLDDTGEIPVVRTRP